MNDSLDAFCLSDDEKLALPLAGQNRLKVVRKQDKNENYLSHHVDDTLNGLEDFDLDAACNVENATSSDHKEGVESLEEGWCSICKTSIPGNQCALHYSVCLKNKYSLKPVTSKLCDDVICTTCGKSTKIIDYPDHAEKCKMDNLKAAKKCFQETVTSSYFAFDNQVVEKEYICPSCGKNLTKLNTTLRTRHVNMCLDSCTRDSVNPVQQRNLRSTTAPGDTTCLHCGRKCKSSRGLKLHEKRCEKNLNQSRPKQKRKIRAPKNAEEELIQLAKGMSASDRQIEKEFIKEEKRSKKDIPVPVMLQSSKETRQADLLARLDVIVAGSSENVVTSTPPLPAVRREGKKVDDVMSMTSSPVIDHSAAVESLQIKEVVCVAAEETHEANKDRKKVESLKWDLGTVNNAEESSFRVHGLLTQFDALPPTQDQCIPESQEIDSTLNTLINIRHVADDDNGNQSKRGEDNVVPLPGETQGGSSINKDISLLRNNPSYSDLQLKCCDGTIYLHKCLLLVRCEALLKVFERDCDVCNVYDATMCSVKDLDSLLAFIYTDHCGNNGLLESCRRLGVKLAPADVSCDAPESNYDTSLKVNDLIVSDHDTSVKANDLLVSDHDSCVKIHDFPVSSCDSSIKSLPSPVQVHGSPIEVRDSPTKSCDDLKDSTLFRNTAESTSRDTDDHSCDVLTTSRIAGNAITDSSEDHKADNHLVMSDDDLFSSFTDNRGLREQPSVTIGGMSDRAEATERSEEKETNLSDMNEELEIEQSDDELAIIGFTPAPKPRGSSHISFSQPLKERSVDVDALALSQPVVGAEEWGASDETILGAICDQIRMKTPKDLRRRSGVVPITPMPNFSDMDTPEIVKKGSRIGLKKSLGKKKLMLKLKELHAYTHQIEPCSDGDRADSIIDYETSPKLSDCSDRSGSTANARRKLEVENARSVLESLSLEEFGNVVSNSLSWLLEKGILRKALERERTTMEGVGGGWSCEMSVWMQRLTPGHPLNRKEWSIMLGLTQNKLQALVDVITSLLTSTPDLKEFQQHIFSAVPLIYRALIRIHPHLRPPTIVSSSR